MDEGGSSGRGRDAVPRASARAVAEYLTALRALVGQVGEARRGWVREFGRLLLEARHERNEDVPRRARRLGDTSIVIFTDVRDRLNLLEPPPTCGPCHDAFAIWLDQQVAACEALIEVGVTDDLDQLRVAHALFVESRYDLRAFSAEYAAALAALRNEIARLGARSRPAPRRRWPFHQPAVPAPE